MRPKDVAIAVLTGIAATVFSFAFFSPGAAVLPGPDVAYFALFVGSVLVLVASVTYRRGRGSDGRSVWDAIPSWQ